MEASCCAFDSGHVARAGYCLASFASIHSSLGPEVIALASLPTDVGPLESPPTSVNGAKPVVMQNRIASFSRSLERCLSAVLYVVLCHCMHDNVVDDHPWTDEVRR